MLDTLSRPSPRLPISTERLLLRELTADDFAAVHCIASDADVARYVSPVPNTRQMTRRYLEQAVAAAGEEPREDYQLAIVERDHGVLIGTCGFQSRVAGGPHEREIGYVLGRAAWGRGFATEVVEGLTRVGFDEFGLQRLFAYTTPTNPASSRVLEKVGFRLEGHLRQYLFTDCEWRDALLYARLATDTD